MLLSACARGHAPDAVESGDREVASSLARRMESYGKAAAEGNADAVLDYWTADSRIVEPAMNMTREEWESVVRDFFAGGGGATRYGSRL